MSQMFWAMFLEDLQVKGAVKKLMEDGKIDASPRFSDIYAKNFSKTVKFLIAPEGEDTPPMPDVDEEFELNTPLGLPFDNCWFEPLRLDGVLYHFGDTNLNVVGLYVQAVGDDYAIYGHGYSTARHPGDGYDFGVIPFHKSLHSLALARQMVRNVLKIINDIKGHKSGRARLKQKFRLGVGRDRTLYKIRDVVVVAPKSLSIGEARGRKVDWTHRWQSSSHWRHFWTDETKTALKTWVLGKDPTGKRGPRGKTWVDNEGSIRGPKGKPLISKIRIVRPPTP